MSRNSDISSQTSPKTFEEVWNAPEIVEAKDILSAIRGDSEPNFKFPLEPCGNPINLYRMLQEIAKFQHTILQNLISDKASCHKWCRMIYYLCRGYAACIGSDSIAEATALIVIMRSLELILITDLDPQDETWNKLLSEGCQTYQDLVNRSLDEVRDALEQVPEMLK